MRWGQVKAIKNGMTVTVNDVLMGVLGCAMHRALKKVDPKGERGIPKSFKVRCLVAFVPVCVCVQHPCLSLCATEVILM